VISFESVNIKCKGSLLCYSVESLVLFVLNVICFSS